MDGCPTPTPLDTTARPCPAPRSSRTSPAAPTRPRSARPATWPRRSWSVGAAARHDDALVERVLHLADTEGLETLAEVWSGAPADTLAGCLWRLYVLRAWVHRSPSRVAEEYDAG